MAQQGQSSSNKGNPAHKRMGNAALKARRNSSWNRAKHRREERVLDQQGRAATNRNLRKERADLIKQGKHALARELVTPWESATAKRRAARVKLFGLATWLPEDLDHDDSVDRNGGSRR